MNPRSTFAAMAASIAIAGSLIFASGAGAEVLHSQIDETSPESITSQDFEPANDSFDALAADDFTVPVGEVWKLDGGLIRGKAFGTTTTTTVNVTIFADAGGLPGATVFAGQVQAPGYPRFELPLATVPELAAGTYWLGVQAVLAGVDFNDPQQWFWAENDDLSGSRAAFRNPGGGFSSCASFGVRSTCMPGHPSPDQSFSLSGTRRDVAAPETTIDAPKKLRLKGRKKTTKAEISFGSSEPGGAFSCRVDSGSPEPCTSPLTVKLKKGAHSIEVVATDAAGNADVSPAEAQIKVAKAKRKRGGR